MGKTYFIEIFPKRLLKSRVIIEKDKLIIFLAENQNQSEAYVLLENFLIEFARSYITKRTDLFCKQFSFEYNRIAIKEQRSRWGSCSSLKNLNFNWRLIFALPLVVDYVILHELAHTKQMNHSKAFWDIVEECMPNYLACRNWLKFNGKSLFSAF